MASNYKTELSKLRTLVYNKVPTKTSIGIILLRQNPTNNKPEVLLAHKRYTYAFADFIHGKYSRGKQTNEVYIRNACQLFSEMTCEELLDVLSLRFDQMWYRVWLTLDNYELYGRKLAKFNSIFMVDNGFTLRKCISQVRAYGELSWEIPKGRKNTSYESNAVCAIRELTEETGIEKNEYRILPGVKRKVSYISAGTRYINEYYIALANPHRALMPEKDNSKPTLRKINLMAEVGEIRWFDIERIRLIDSRKHLENLIKPAFKLMKKYLKGRWGYRHDENMFEMPKTLPF